MHFDGILGENELSVVLKRQFFKSEEAHIGEDHVQVLVIPVGADRIEFEKYLIENFQKFFISDAPIKDLLDEHSLIGVLDCYHVIVRMRINGMSNWIKCFDDLDTVVDEF